MVYLLIFYFMVEVISLNSLDKQSSIGIFPDDYDKYQPPWNKENPAHVYVQLNIMDLDKIDDGAMEYSIQSYLGEFWKDDRLNLSVYLSEMSSFLNFPVHLTKHIWVPDLVFDNTRHGVLFDLSQPNTIVQLWPTGYFVRLSRYTFIVGCQMEFRLYPIDIQKCFMKIGSMANPDFKLLLHWSEDHVNGGHASISFKNDIQPLKYTLEEPKSYKNTEFWPSGNYTYLYANFTFIRRISGSIFHVYVPSILVVSLSWISFWIDVEAVPARITLGVTSLLTIVTQMTQAHSELPPISYMTAIDVWLLACLIMVFSSLIEFAVSYHLFISNRQKKFVKRISCITPKEERRQLKSRIRQDLTLKIISSTQSLRKSRKNAPIRINQIFLDNISRKFFPAAFSLFTAFYWIYYLYIVK